LGATDEQLDFPIVYASALNGYAGMDDSVREGDMTPLYQTIVDSVAPPDVDADGPFQMQVSSLDYNPYMGIMGIGKIQRGRIKTNTQVKVIDREGNIRSGRILQIMGFYGLERVEVPTAQAGDIIVFSGLDPLFISDTICDPEHVKMLPPLTVDEPTVSMSFNVNTSPFAGKEGKYVTSRQIRDRLHKELLHNVALRVEDTEEGDKFRVSGRGELHLSILIENMRREGFELGVGRPEVIIREVDGVKQEPYEQLVVDIEEQNQGAVMEKLGIRRGELRNMQPDGKGRVRLEYIIPSRGLIGFRTEFMTATQGTGLLFSVFDHYGDYKPGNVGQRINGVLIANETGKALSYALYNLQDRGKMMIGHGDEVYEGQVVGIHTRDNDLTVNVLKGKKLTNMRASGTDEALTLVTPVRYTLEQALEFIDDDELVEVTPVSVRIRKKWLTEMDRKRYGRGD
jgi:GTP-binding protein